MQNVLSRNVGWFVFCEIFFLFVFGVFLREVVFCLLSVFWFWGFISYLAWGGGKVFFFQGALFCCDAVCSNLSSHVPLEIQCLIFSYINYCSVLESFSQKTYILKL